MDQPENKADAKTKLNATITYLLFITVTDNR